MTFVDGLPSIRRSLRQVAPNRIRRGVALILPAMLSLVSLANAAGQLASEDPLATIRIAVGDRALSYDVFETPTSKLVDCSRIPDAELMEQSPRIGAPTLSQYIVDRMIQYQTLNFPHGRCVYLLSPIRRGLSREDSLLFLSAANMEFPVPIADMPELKCDPLAGKPTRPEPMPTLSLAGYPIPLQNVAAPLGTNPEMDVPRPAATTEAPLPPCNDLPDGQ